LLVSPLIPKFASEVPQEGCELRNRDTRPGEDKEAGVEGNLRALSLAGSVGQAAAGAVFGWAAPPAGPAGR